MQRLIKISGEHDINRWGESGFSKLQFFQIKLFSRPSLQEKGVHDVLQDGTWVQVGCAAP